MTRVRVSTTVDGHRLNRCRELLGEPDSTIIDRALRALLAELQTQHEVASLAAAPYEEDPDLSWSTPQGPDLAYDGEVPDDVLTLARQRREAAGR